MMRPEIGLGTSKVESTSLREDLVDLRVGLAEDPDRVLRRLEVAFRGLLVGGGLVDILLRAAARFQKLGSACERPGLQLQHAGACQKRGFRLQQIGAVDREQDIALPDLVPEVEEGLEYLAGILREHLHQHILVEIDGTDRGLQRFKVAQLHRSDLQRPGLFLGQLDKLQRRFLA
jgi:hypothetical protein